MKRILAGLSALTIAGVMALTAFAQADNTEIGPDTNGSPTPDNAGTTVNYDSDVRFMVTIPKSVTLTDSTAGTPFEISASDVHLLFQTAIAVSIDGSSELKVTSDEGAELPYTIMKGSDSCSPGDKVAVFDNDDSESLTFKIDPNAVQYAGEYDGTLTFNISVVESNG